MLLRAMLIFRHWRLSPLESGAECGHPWRVGSYWYYVHQAGRTSVVAAVLAVNTGLNWRPSELKT